MDSVNLTGHFLIAMPALADRHFARSLIYLCEHNARGALGVIVNRPLDITLQNLFEQVGITPENAPAAAAPVYFGGPVQTDRGFVLHQPVGHWQSTLTVEEDIGLTTSKDILEAAGHNAGPDRLIVTLGYAGWGAGQLEHELAQNAWLNVPAEAGILFDLSWENRLTAAMSMLGVNLASLSEEAGHA